MAAKKTFVLRLDEAAYSALEKWAADDFRSVNGQLEWIIDRALREAGRSSKQAAATGKLENHASKSELAADDESNDNLT